MVGEGIPGLKDTINIFVTVFMLLGEDEKEVSRENHMIYIDLNVCRIFVFAGPGS